VVGAKTFTADELTGQGDGYCSTASADNLTAPCVQFCWEHESSCGSTFEGNSVGMACTSIGDLPTTMTTTTTMTTMTMTSTTTSSAQPPCRDDKEACWINQDCCSARCSNTLRCAPL